MKITNFDYNLPPDHIAIFPPKVRGTSRLLTLNKSTGGLKDMMYQDISELLNPGDVLVLNNTKVIKARLHAKTVNNKDIELVVLEKHGEEKNNKVLYKGKIKAGDKLFIQENTIIVKEILDGGIAIVEASDDLYSFSSKYGNVPIPPYLKRESNESDEERYQTVFAQKEGSVAAPTASLNFTPSLEKKLLDKGIKIVYLTLHVGLGTFLPVREDDVDKHKMHFEYFNVPPQTLKAIIDAKINKKRVVALGTTVTRTLEYIFSNKYNLEDFTKAYYLYNEAIEEINGEADIFIYPGYELKIVDVLITNFHAPRSTVLLLAAAFAGWDNLKISYEHAINEKYYFLSYGDSMFIY